MKEHVIKRMIETEEIRYESFDGEIFEHKYDCIEYENEKTIEHFKTLVDIDKTSELSQLLEYPDYKEIYGDYSLILPDLDDYNEVTDYRTAEVLTIKNIEDLECVVRHVIYCREIDDCVKETSIRDEYMAYAEKLDRVNKFILVDRDNLVTYEQYKIDWVYYRDQALESLILYENVIKKIEEYEGE